MQRRIPSVSARALRRWTAAVVVVDAAVVVTGAAVRLTGSGLGCPTWPNCTGDQVGSAGLGLRGAIEFGNRLVGIAAFAVLVVTAVLAACQRPGRRDLRRLSAGLVAGFFANGVIGGITVLTHLNPGVVAVHFLFNMALLVAAAAVHRRAGSAPLAMRASGPLPPLARATVVVAGFVLLAGTLATGSGPHGGDPGAPRFHLGPLDRVTAVHADAAMLLTGLVAALVLVARATPTAHATRRATVRLLLLVAAQAALGFTQYLLDLPAVLVLAHVAGATLLWLAAIDLDARLRRPPAPTAVLDQMPAARPAAILGSALPA